MRAIALSFCTLFAINLNAQKSYEKPISIISQETIYINSATNLTGNTRRIISFDLPANTVKWYYSFSAFRNSADIENVRQTFNLFSKLSYLVDESGTTAKALTLLGKPPGANYCDVYLLDKRTISAFENKQQFNYYTEFSREGLVSGIIEVQNEQLTNGTQYLGFRNEDLTNGINLVIQVVAIIDNNPVNNGWTREQKQELFLSIKRSFINNGLAKYLNNEQIEQYTGCILSKFTSKFSPESIKNYAEYELKQVLTDFGINCDKTLELHLEEKIKSNTK